MNCKICDICCIDAGRDQRRGYVQCPRCKSVFVHHSDYLHPVQERLRYELHHNTAENPGYCSYLATVADEIDARIPQARRALDYGSGPARVLETILNERGRDACSYDPLYGIGESCLTGAYDVIVICEVIEHVRDIAGMRRQLTGLLHAGSFLFIRTCLLRPEIDFHEWWYKEDPTHINFFTETSLDSLVASIGLSVIFTDGNRLVIGGPGGG